MNNATPVKIDLPIDNSARSAGAMLAGRVAAKYGHEGLIKGRTPARALEAPFFYRKIGLEEFKVTYFSGKVDILRGVGVLNSRVPRSRPNAEKNAGNHK